MGRSRILHPDFFKNETLGALGYGPSLLFAGLWCLADRDGRLDDRPARIRIEIFPYRPDADVNQMLDDLARSGMIVRYEVNNCKYLCIKNFLKYQKPHPREHASSIPPPPAPCTADHDNLGSPKADLGLPKVNLGSPKADLGHAKDTPRLPVSISVSVSDSISPQPPKGGSAGDSDSDPIRPDPTDEQKAAADLDAYQPGATILAGTVIPNDAVAERIAPFRAAWHQRFGGYPKAGKLEADLLPVMQEHGDAEVLTWWERYLDSRLPGEQRFLSSGAFARQPTDFRRATAIPAAKAEEPDIRQGMRVTDQCKTCGEIYQYPYGQRAPHCQPAAVSA